MKKHEIISSLKVVFLLLSNFRSASVSDLNSPKWLSSYRISAKILSDLADEIEFKNLRHESN